MSPTTENSTFNSILSNIQGSLKTEEKEISFFNKYFIFTRKSKNAKIVESMSEHLYNKLTAKGTNPSEKSLKDYISVILKLKQDDNFNKNYIKAETIAVQRITKETLLKKSEKKVTKSKVVNLSDSDNASSSSVSSSSLESDSSSSKIKIKPAKKGISLGKTKKKIKKKRTNKKENLSKKWLKFTSLISSFHEAMIHTKSKKGKIDKKSLEKILKNCEKLNILAEKLNILDKDKQAKSNPELFESLNIFNEVYDYFSGLKK